MCSIVASGCCWSRTGYAWASGQSQWWDAVHAALDSIDGVTSVQLDPLRLPPDFPLALEMDAGPHDQTLFFLGADGVLTGETWVASRNVLRVNYGLNLEQPEQVRLAVVPEVRQRLHGWRWVRHEAGISQVPDYNGRAFGAAGFAVDLDPGEFLMIAPNQRADVYGMVGGAFLVQEEEGTRYDSYVFLHADMNDVAYRD